MEEDIPVKMFIPLNVAIVVLIVILILMAFLVIAIRQVRILDRELEEAQRRTSPETPRGGTKT